MRARAAVSVNDPQPSLPSPPWPCYPQNTATKEERKKMVEELRKIGNEPDAVFLRDQLRHTDGFETPSYKLQNDMVLTPMGIRVEPHYGGRKVGYYRRPNPHWTRFDGTAEQEAARIRSVLRDLCETPNRATHDAHHGETKELLHEIHYHLADWLRNHGIGR